MTHEKSILESGFGSTLDRIVFVDAPPYRAPLARMFELASHRDKKPLDRRADGDERVVLVHVDEPDIDAEDAIAELQELALAAGAQTLAVVRCPDRTPNAALFIGRGKVEEIQEAVRSGKADAVIFDPPLSPGQERNLERKIECRVIDRRALILDIFARRASTFEGKLQVELAQLAHLSTRLVRGWTHLERQKGGIGLRGPGETQLETDRRLIDRRIRTVRSRLDRVRSRRGLSRRSRDRSQVPLVAFVGYTNAGKSTLFNRLTGAATLVRDQLFATLDPTLRRLDPKGEFGSGSEVILADTVGFIRRLPTDLVAAFRATLEETRNASLLVHVVDAAAADRREKMREVHEVLKAIKADEIPRIEIFNKSDLLDAGPAAGALGSDFEEENHGEAAPAGDMPAGEGIAGDETRSPRVFVSAITGEGLPDAVRAIRESVDGGCLVRVACIPATDGRLRSTLYRSAQVMNECGEPDGAARMTFRIEAKVFERLCRETALERCLADGP